MLRTVYECVHHGRQYIRWRDQGWLRTVSARVLLLTCCLLTVAPGWPLAKTGAENSQMTHYTVNILRTLPHSTKSFTQGFLYHDGMLYESTGLVGQSSLQKLDPISGKVLVSMRIADVFAEGLARWENHLIQLTWKDRCAYMYNISDFSQAGVFQYHTEGWGLTSSEHHLIMSDGTDVLYFRNPHTFAVEKTLHITFQGHPLPYLNELEYVDGSIYANVWYQNVIVQIDPGSGNVIGIIQVQPIFRILPPLHGDSVLNGIAYNPSTHTFYLTGKNWPNIFEVTLVQEL